MLFYYSEVHKARDLNAILQLQKYIPCNITVYHVHGYQEQRKKKDQLTLAEKFNIKVDEIIGKHAQIPKNIHIHNTSFMVYIGTKFILNHFAKAS